MKKELNKGLGRRIRWEHEKKRWKRGLSLNTESLAKKTSSPTRNRVKISGRGDSKKG